MEFPVNISEYKELEFSLDSDMTPEQLEQLKKNVQICRDAIVFFTAFAGAKGLGGHTGGAYDIVPEVLILDGFMKKGLVYPVHFDEAGHRVAIQYLMAVLHGELDLDRLFHYREFSEKNPLPGHPEKGLTDGVKFSSGRLGHMWAFANGVAKANDKPVIVYGSDGSQQEGNDAEAARFAVANNLNIKLIIDDNDVTIAGHPTEYMKGYDLEKTLTGHGLKVSVGDPENLEKLFSRIKEALNHDGPFALINKRKMAIGVSGLEGDCKGHDVISTDLALNYLEERNLTKAIELLKNVEKLSNDYEYSGSKDVKKNRSEFGKIVSEIMKKSKKNVYVIDSDLQGSTGINAIGKDHPDVFVNGGIMERQNYSAAAGFGYEKGNQGVFATFSAFSEMVISEITMARLNEANVVAHFSHAGVDDMADNTCHFGINLFFTDNGLDEKTKLYYPADAFQLKACLEKTFYNEGLRFYFTTRSGVPQILKEDGSFFYEKYSFSEKDDLIRDGEGFIVTYGEMTYRALDAVERLKKEGINVGLINKHVLNVIDEDMMKKLSKSPFVLVVETQNEKTGLGVRFGTWLLQRGFSGKYKHVGTTKLGHGGVHEQVGFQGLESADIIKRVKDLIS